MPSERAIFMQFTSGILEYYLTYDFINAPGTSLLLNTPTITWYHDRNAHINDTYHILNYLYVWDILSIYFRVRSVHCSF